jgi:DNA-binding MarR family transcriptional regulator
MSDGNFNRALLPKNELTAGLRAGKAQMRTRAERAFTQTIEQYLPHLTAQEREQLRESFMQLLRN